MNLIKVVSETNPILIGGSVVAIATTAVAAVVAFVKVRPESASLLVDAAQDVVIIQRGAIDDLRTEISAMRNRLEQAESGLALMAGLQSRVDFLDSENTRLEKENTSLRRRVLHLEGELKAIRTEQNEQNGKNGH